MTDQEVASAHDRRLEVMADLIADYEAVHGTITDEEMAQQAPADRVSAALTKAGLSQPSIR